MPSKLINDGEGSGKTPCGNSYCGISTGIHDGLTFGRGKLDDNGYWEVPCAICARAWEVKFPNDGACWPFNSRSDSWKQNNPNDQLVAIINSIQGHSSNLADGILTIKRIQEVGRLMMRQCEELMEITKMLPKTEWPKE